MHKSLISSTTAVHYWHKPVVCDICLWCRNAVDVLGLLYSLVMFLCEKKMMIGWRNVWSMKLRVQDQEEDQRGPGEVVREDCQARKMNKVDAIDRCKWRKMIEDVRWSGWVWVSVSSGTGLPGLSRTKAVKRLCVCVCVCVCVTCKLTAKNWDRFRNPTLGNWVWATFTYHLVTASSNDSAVSSNIAHSITICTTVFKFQHFQPQTNLIFSFCSTGYLSWTTSGCTWSPRIEPVKIILTYFLQKGRVSIT